MHKVLPLQGIVQHYDWGGFDYLPHLLNLDNAGRRPFAELWMGAHPRGAARVFLHSGTAGLDELISRMPEIFLGEQVANDFHFQLPFLFKVLDVRKMLSIQAHPTKADAEAGFRRENEAGIPLDAPNRNYKDENHKPEVMVALTDFWLLHGFKARPAIASTLAGVPEFRPLAQTFGDGNLLRLYKTIMEMPQQEVDTLLGPLWQRLEPLAKAGQLHKDQPDYWAALAFQDYTRDGHFDRGIFSIYLFNLVHIRPGEGIYQGAGVPHAYLEGVNVELMANSDNVFRGGLTSKHIDVGELLQSLLFEPVTPQILTGGKGPSGRTVFPTPAPDFQLSRFDLPAGETCHLPPQEGPSIFLLTDGKVRTGDHFFEPGGIFFVLPGHKISITAGERAILFQAGMPD